jgi:hydrogenase maturation protein HypF
VNSHTLPKSIRRPRFDRALILHPATAPKVRLKVAIRGAVQGVGFRPFVFRLAEELKLTGSVHNSPQGVFIEVEGARAVLENFLLRLVAETPPRGFIQNLEPVWLDAVGLKKFEIRASENVGGKSALVLPDIATCPDCLRDIYDSSNRRFRYPFTNCTHCGPRFSLIESLPYDRANTVMKRFPLCPACRAEYRNPRDRRFHAQPNACPVCGPQLELWSATGEKIFGDNQALLAAAQQMRRGKIVAVKGVGGFHLFVDARNEKNIGHLRARKHREEKPFALMFPTISTVKGICEVSAFEEILLASPAAPIVILRRKKFAGDIQPSAIADSVAPNNPNYGVMLPANPLHHLLLLELDFPVVATSGNLSDEPICTDEHEALARLCGIADFFLVHDRPIVRPLDDSIVRVMLGREIILRRARGYAPLPIRLKSKVPSPKSNVVLAVGAHLKNSVALAVGESIFISQHLGDLETEAASDAFQRAVADLPKLYDVRPEIVAADLHPDYRSTKFAHAHGQKLFGVQHHVAHVLSCIAENEIFLPALGVAWDGTGYGPDGTIWGGEFFLIAKEKVERVAHLRQFRLPGGDQAVKEPRRAALGLLYELYGESVFEMNHLALLREMPPVEMITLKGMLQRRFNSPLTSSVGRLFDVVASLVGLRQRMQFEGQAAMELEFAINNLTTDARYDLSLVTNQTALVLDWSRMIPAILADVRGGVSVAEISAKFHNALAEAVVAIVKQFGQPRVVLSGGCFQNRYLTERVVTRLRAENFQPYWHQRVPPNDGGIALGQIYAARNNLSLK